MPDDRFIHPKLGHSIKVGGLSDFHFRVWATYILAADDCGVMRASAIALQDTNVALERRAQKTVQAALEDLIRLDLINVFEHQGRRFVYQWDWQDWQKVRYPRASIHPDPPPDVLVKCSELTQELFRIRAERFRESSGNGAGIIPEDSRKAAEVLPKDYGDSSEVLRSLPRAGGRDRLTANGKRLTANGFDHGFSEFWDAYPRKVGKDAAKKAYFKRHPDAELHARMLAAIAAQVRNPAWLEEAGRFIPHPATWLNAGRWEDEPVAVHRAMEPSRWQDACTHDPPCSNATNCANLQAIEAYKAEQHAQTR